MSADWGFTDIDAARWGVHRFLELVQKWLNSAAPKSRIRGLEIFDQLLDMAPDGVTGNVGIECSGEEEPFIEELVESIEFRGIWWDFGRWE